jgi:hypothetical protein
MIHPVLLLFGTIAVAAGAGAYGLAMRDLVRRGRLQRRNEELARRGLLPALPEGRVPCPECAEAILPAARRCPFCRSVVPPRE